MRKIDNIIIVDDDEIALQLHMQLIEFYDVANNIETITSGEEALDVLKKYLKENKIYNEILILLDLNMPSMDGFEFLDEFKKELLNKFPMLNIVLVSSSVSQRDQKRAAEYEIAGYIEKPLTEQKLVQLIKSIRGKHSLLANSIK